MLKSKHKHNIKKNKKYLILAFLCLSILSIILVWKTRWWGLFDPEDKPIRDDGQHNSSGDEVSDPKDKPLNYAFMSLTPKPKLENEIIFLGDSITWGWKSFLSNNFSHKDIGIKAKNGAKIRTLWNKLLETSNLNYEEKTPKKIFLMIGINNFNSPKASLNKIFWEYENIILRGLKNTWPDAKIYIQSILPINQLLFKKLKNKEIEKMIIEMNEKLKSLAEPSDNLIYVNLYSVFEDSKNVLNSKYTRDGLHLNSLGYEVWSTFLKNQKLL